MLSVPWARLAAAGLLLIVLMDLVRRWPYFLWPLEGIAVGLLAAAAAWCLDEPAGAVVDAAPRPLWWRTVARSAGIAGILGVWTLAVWSARHSLFDHPWDVWTQGLTGSAVGVAWATWRRSVGVRVPGIAFAASLVPVAALWALVRPFGGTIPVFPYAGGDWATSTTGWIGAGVAASVCIMLVLSDVRWWRVGVHPVPAQERRAPA
jgi:hypothetical protein